MSVDLAPSTDRPTTRDRAQMPSDINQWRADVFMAKGWSAKSAQMEQLQDDIAKTFKTMEEATLRPGVGPHCADALASENLEPGKEFQTYLAALQLVERTTPPRPENALQLLRDKAQAYLDHYKKHTPSQQKQANNLRKKAACEATLADLRRYDLRKDLINLGPLPWSSEKGMQAAQLKATLDFESLPPESREMETLDGAHAYPAFWVNKSGTTGDKTKSFIFKPNPTDDDAEAEREAITGRASEILTGMTGLHFGVPETHMVKLSLDKFPASAFADADPPPKDPLSGSLQQFAPTNGQLREQNLGLLRQIPSEECQKMAILDTVMLNMDRHAGNFLIDTTGGPPKLVPIDHGLTLPDAANGGRLKDAMAGELNALLTLPGSHEPFSQEMLKSIANIDPGAMKAALRKERDTLNSVHPGAGNKITDESLEMSRRSAAFLKLAAPVLTPAAVQIALGQNQQSLFDPTIDEPEFQRRAAAAIQRTQSQQGALKEYYALTVEERGNLEAALVANGWPNDRSRLDSNWLNQNTATALAVWKTDTKNPALVTELNGLIGQAKMSELLKTETLFKISETRDKYMGGRPLDLDSNSLEQARSIAQTFSKEYVSPESEDGRRSLIGRFRRFEQLGGKAALERAITTLGLPLDKAKDARLSLDSALRVLRSAAATEAGAGAASPEDIDRAGVSKSLDYLDSLIKYLPNDRVRPARAIIQKYRDNLGTPAMQADKSNIAAMKIALLDVIRKRLNEELKLMTQRVERSRMKGTEEEARFKKQAGLAEVQINSAIIEGARTALDRLRTNFLEKI